MDYKLIRSGRKSLSLSVDRSGRLIVRAPLYYPESRINEFIEQKRSWIEKHAANAEENNHRRRHRLSEPPKELPFLGEMAKVSHEQPYGYTDGVFHLPENMTLEKLLPYLRRLYCSIAKETLPSRARLTAGRMGISLSDVRINSAKTRWGSCSSRKAINLSWKLMAADPALIDYVIVHELCHTYYMNHSDEFWAKVGEMIPDYRERREALKNVQEILSEYGFE